MKLRCLGELVSVIHMNHCKSIFRLINIHCAALTSAMRLEVSSCLWI